VFGLVHRRKPANRCLLLLRHHLVRARRWQRRFVLTSFDRVALGHLGV
jgi:hypothetical protein